MSALLAKPIFSRFVGALGAGAATYVVGHDFKASAVTALTFLIYGAGHTAATSATASTAPERNP